MDTRSFPAGELSSERHAQHASTSTSGEPAATRGCIDASVDDTLGGTKVNKLDLWTRTAVEAICRSNTRMASQLLESRP